MAELAKEVRALLFVFDGLDELARAAQGWSAETDTEGEMFERPAKPADR